MDFWGTRPALLGVMWWFDKSFGDNAFVPSWETLRMGGWVGAGRRVPYFWILGGSKDLGGASLLRVGSTDSKSFARFLWGRVIPEVVVEESWLEELNVYN